MQRISTVCRVGKVLVVLFLTQQLMMIRILGLNSQTRSVAFERERRVIGGRDAPANQFPWAVAIRGNIPGSTTQVAMCGATIIGNRWLITAAHCFWSVTLMKQSDLRDPRLWHIVAGQIFVEIESYIDNIQTEMPENFDPSILDEIKDLISEDYQDQSTNRDRTFENLFALLLNNLQENGLQRKRRSLAEPPKLETISVKDLANHFHVEKIVLHPKYKPDVIEYDIALMRLDRVLPVGILPSINAIELPPSDKSPLSYPKPSDSCVVVGWGCLEYGGDSTTTAQFATLEVVSHATCNRLYQTQNGLNKYHEFCAGYDRRGVGICKGDSGGGLACKNELNQWYIAGITSASHGMMPGEFPGFFTRVAFFLDWINSTIAN